MKPETVKDILEFAPHEPGTIAAGLVGWETRDGFCYCSTCVGRAMRRGFTGNHLGCSIPVWNRALKCDACGKSYDASGIAKEERPAG